MLIDRTLHRLFASLGQRCRKRAFVFPCWGFVPLPCNHYRMLTPLHASDLTL